MIFFNNDAYTKQIILDSLVNRTLFSWEKTAYETLQVYHKLLKKGVV